MKQTSVKRFIGGLLLTTSLAMIVPGTAGAVPVLFGGDNMTVDGAAFSGDNLPADAVVTVTGALLQLQLADGSIITVPEGSSFRITGEGDTLSIELLSGSIRVDSRGTPISVARGDTVITSSGGAYSAFASEGGGLDGRVNTGVAQVVAGGETRSFNAGEGYVASSTGVSGTFTPPPTQTTQMTPGNEPSYSPADERGEGGAQQVAIVALEDGGIDPDDNSGNPDPDPDPDPNPPYVDNTPGTSSGSVDAALGAGDKAIAYAAYDIGLDVRSEATTQHGGDGVLEEYSWGSDENLAAGTNLTADLGGNALVTVGRWNGGTTGGHYYAAPDFTFGGQQGFHYAAGVGTATPITSGTATYSLFKATSPTFGDGRSAPGTLTGSLAVNFGLVTRIGLDLEVDMPGDHIYLIRTTGGVTTPSTSQVQMTSTGWGNIGPVFYGEVAMSDGGIACQIAGQCSAALRGFFAGDNAEGVGLSYQIGDAGYPIAHGIYGAAIFTGSGVTGGGTPSSGVSSGSISAPLGAGPYMLAINNVLSGNPTGIVLDSDGALESYTSTGAGDGGRGTTAVADLWGNEDVTIGRWNGGTVTGYPVYLAQDTTTGTLYPNLQSIHYAVGTPLTDIPVYGMANYSLAGWTAPTFRDGGTEPGIFSGSMAIAYGAATPKVGFDLAVNMPGDRVYEIVTPGGVENPHLSQYFVNVTLANAYFGTIQRSGGAGDQLKLGDGTAPYGRACPSNAACNVDINGMLSGDGGTSAAITYHIRQFGAGGQEIDGAAAFTRDGAVEGPTVTGSVSSPYADGSYNGISIRAPQSANSFQNTAMTFGASGELLTIGTSNVGSTDVADLGKNEYALWGRWTGGATGGSGTYAGQDLSGNRSMHFLITDKKTQNNSNQVPSVGTATYELAGATSATSSDGSQQPGTLSGNIAVQWDYIHPIAMSKVAMLGVDLNVDMPGDAIYHIKTAGGIADPASGGIMTGSYAAFQGTAPVTFTGASAAACPSGSCSAANIRATGYGDQTIAGGVQFFGLSYGIGGGAAPHISGVGVFTPVID